MSALSTAALTATWSRARLMGALFSAQVSASTGHSMSLAVGGILAAQITGSNASSGLPVAVGALGGALASWPLARLMGRSGRRVGLVAGYALAVLGAELCMVGVLVQSFALLLVGMALFGIANTSNLLARYAAADVSAPEQRGRAMGFIVWGGAAGSILGPTLMGPFVALGRPLGLSPAGSAFLISVAGYALALVIIHVLLRPDPLAIARRLHESAAVAAPARSARSVRAIFADPRVRIALVTLMSSQLVMIGTTSTSPVYLHDQGYHVDVIGVAVAMHLGGMYVSSPLSGWLADRLGRLPVIGLGGALLIGAVALAGLVPGREGALVIIGLFLNGIGWNMAFVAGSALLTDALSPAERTSIQGLADLVMGLMGALGSAAGGLVLGVWGFAVLNLLGAAFIAGPLGGVWMLRAGMARGGELEARAR